MGKKSRSRQATSPPYQHTSFAGSSNRQPPVNPYYHEHSSAPPPPYTDVPSTPQVITLPHNALSGPGYPTLMQNNMSQQQPMIVVQQPAPLRSTLSFDARLMEYQRRVRRINSNLLFISLVTLGMSAYAYSLYSSRLCVPGFIVHNLTKDLPMTMTRIKEMHLYTCYISIAMLFMCLIKTATGSSKNSSFYLFLMGLLTFLATVFTGYMAYLAFYSPCSLKANELGANAAKTLVGWLTNDAPSPDKGIFHESNVIQLAKEDGYGLIIFVMDATVFWMYFAGFLTAIK